MVSLIGRPRRFLSQFHSLCSGTRKGRFLFRAYSISELVRLRYELRIGGGTSGNSSGGEFDGYAGAGYEFRSGGLAFGAIASLEYTDVGVSEYQEQGSLAPLRILSQDQDSLRTNLDWAHRTAGRSTKFSSSPVCERADNTNLLIAPCRSMRSSAPELGSPLR
jgi:Autotransporter beta-domain